MSHNYNEILNDITHRNIDLKKPYEAPTRSEHYGNDIEQKKHLSACINPRSNYLCKYYSSVFGWIAANPSNTTFQEAINEIKITPTEPDLGSSNNYMHANTKTGSGVFFNDISDKNDNTIALTGLKGTGKTFFINDILNNKSDDLFEKNIIWFRTDFSSIYKKYIYNNNTSPEISLNEYLDAHICYIVLHHRNDLAVFNNIVDNSHHIKDMIFEVYRNSNIYSENIQDPDEIWDFFKYIREIFSNTNPDEQKSNSIAKSQRKIIHNLLLKKNKKNELSIISKALLHTLKDLSYHLLLIFDGIDNIDYYNNYNLYRTFLDELAEFCFSDDRDEAYCGKKIICLRDETYHHLLKIPGYAYENFITEFTLCMPNINELLENKLNTCIASDASYFVRKKIEATKKIDSLNENEKVQGIISENHNTSKYSYDLSSEFKKFGLHYIDNLTTAINDILPIPHLKEPISPRSLLRLFFNNNLRAFQCNFVNSYRYHRTFKENLGISANKSYIFIEGLLLNGRLSLNTSSDKYSFGKVIPNIFWFSTISSTDKWHGLTIFRIIQYLMNRNKRYKTMVDELSNLFGYNKSILRKSISYALGHGLIISKFSIEFNRQSFSVSKKGLLLLILPFTDLNIFYHLALDTPLSHYALRRQTHIEIHSFEGKLWANYLSSSVITSLTFLRHILTCHKKESSGIPIEERDRYNLPSIFPERLLDQIKESLIKLRKKNKSAHDTTCLKIQSVAYDDAYDDEFTIII